MSAEQWTYRAQEFGGRFSIFEAGERSLLIAETAACPEYLGPGAPRQAEKRARLIAALPDLLAAIQLAQTFCQQRGGSWAEFEAAVNSAIARATGGAS